MKLVVELNKKEKKIVAGIDEVGRGCLAGPLVTAAVVLPKNCQIRNVRDSKLLTVDQRNKLSIKIKQKALAIGIGWVSPAEIDENGLSQALERAASRALDNLNLTPDYVILDGRYNYLKKICEGEALVGADRHCLPVAAASIIAKVARDNYMKNFSHMFPEYGFKANVGYGTKQHLSALGNFGINWLHRRSFAPIRKNQDLHFSRTERLNVD
ncbi:MAG: ribonuclease HII [Candidatus Saccharimonadales bacterium]